MTPTHGNGSPGGDSPEHGPTDPPAVPIPLPRLRRTPRPRTSRHPRPARPSTVWPCAQNDLREGTGLLASWLLTAVIKIVATYTQPGQRVLLLDPTPDLAPPASWPATAVRNPSRRGPYAGLREAGWTVVRLGRGVQTQTAVARPDEFSEHPVDGPTKTESGPGPRAVSPSTDRPPGAPADRHRGSDPATSGPSPDHYDLIITAAEPRALDWLPPTDWAGMLTPAGSLAVITHSDRSSGRLTDPASPLVRAAQHAGLRHLDRIALLRVPIRDGALAVATPVTHYRSQTPAGPLTTPVRHTLVHDDLLVFTHQPSITADGEETSDD